jgi:mannose-6-phosphate isomerase
VNRPPVPVVFEPLFKPKPWGGRRLATLLNKTLPADTPIGESWELVSLPGVESRVRDGPLAGRTLHDLVQVWGRDLLGDADLIDGRFPLLVKFLDATEPLSVQVHPSTGPGAKEEAWYVIHADPGSKLFAGLKDGVGPEEVARVANTPNMADVLRVWDGRPGDCYYLPSGTLHALGAGLVVAEVQTPSDVTYRAYDWGRVGLDGRPRELHVEKALANIRYEVTAKMISPQAVRARAPFGEVTRLLTCERFGLDRVCLPAGPPGRLPRARLRIWIVLRGDGRVVGAFDPVALRDGDVVLLPAVCAASGLESASGCTYLEVTVPGAA